MSRAESLPVAWSLVVALLMAVVPLDGAEIAANVPAGRRPIAVAVTRDGASAWVACETGSLMQIGIEHGRIEQDIPISGRLTDLVLDPAGHWLAVTDAAAHQLVIARTDGSGSKIGRFAVPPHPVACAVTSDGGRVAVTSLWSRRVTWFETARLLTGAADPGRSVPLPFAPRKCLWLPDGRSLLVADAFAGRLAVIDADAAKVASVREIPGHNIAGMTLARQAGRVYLTHQIIHRGAPTSRDAVHWGGILTNVVRSLAVSDLLDSHADILAHNRTDYLGDVGRGAGDPAGVAVLAEGLIVVAFAGVNEVAFDRGLRLDWNRVTVGQRPTTLALTPDNRHVVVANMLDDSISIVSLQNSGRVERTLQLSPAQTLTAAERGERLFYDATLSHDGWFSCHSCHTDGHSNRQLVDNLTDGSEGTPKRVLSLLGVRDTAPYAWDGRMPNLAAQVKHSVLSTMQGHAVTDTQVAELVAFLETLNPPLPLRSESDEPQREQGRQVFRAQRCARCHEGDTYTSAETYDVGLADERELRRFNPPSLRGVGQGGPFFHDGRYERLEDVLAKELHELTAPLSPQDQAALLTFLEGL
jgi:cytochrome c peroxidase